MFARVSEKIDTDVTQTRESITEYIDDKVGAVSGDVQQVRKIADEMSKVKATLGEL